MASVDPPSRSPATIRVRTFGGFAVTQDGGGGADLALSGLSAALLVFLAVERTATRDQVIGLLWPERDGRRARHSLSQVLYELKGTLGPGWVERAGERLATSERIDADAVAFERAVERGAFGDAFRLYRGPFLAGTYLRDTVPFERWVDRRRDHLTDLHRRACRKAAERRRDRGDRAGAIAAAQRWAESEPFAAWEGTRWKKRGEEYDALKNRLAGRLLEVLHEYVPQARGRIDTWELSTPLTTRHFCDYPRGEIYGLAHTPRRFEQRWLRPRTPVPGLYLTGQDIATCGVAGALIGGALSASAILGRNLLGRIAAASGARPVGRTPPTHREPATRDVFEGPVTGHERPGHRSNSGEAA